MFRSGLGPLVFQKREMDPEEAIKLLVQEFPNLKLFETRTEPHFPKSAPSSARSHTSSDMNESRSSVSPDSAHISRLGSEHSTAATRTAPPAAGSNLRRSSSADAPARIAKELPPELSLHHIELGDTTAIPQFLRKGGDANSLIILNRPIMHFLLINAAENDSLFPKALDFFNALLPHVDLSLPDKKGQTILDLLETNRTNKLKILLQAKETLALLNASKIEALTLEIENRLHNLEEKIKSLGVKVTKQEHYSSNISTVRGMIEAISTTIKKISHTELFNYLAGVLVSFEPVTLISEIHTAWPAFNLSQQLICLLLIGKLLADDVQHDLIQLVSFMLKLTQFNKECVATMLQHGTYFETELSAIIHLKSQFQTQIALKNYWFLTDNFLLEATAGLPPIKDVISQSQHSDAALTHAAGTLAHELNAVYLSVYKCTRYGEFRDGAWGKAKKGYRAAHLAMLPNISEQLNCFVAQLIFTTEPAHIPHYLTLIILTAATLLSPKNGFPPNLFMASQLLATLAQHDIARLETIFDLLPSRYNKMLADLKQFTTGNTFKWIRLFEKADPNAPLHIGILQRDLAIARDGNSDLSLASINGTLIGQFVARQKKNLTLTCQFNTDFAYQILQAPYINFEMQSKNLVGVVIELTGSFKEICATINKELSEHLYPRFRVLEQEGLTTFTTATVENGIFKLFMAKLATEENIEEADFKMAKTILEKLDRLIPKQPVDGNPFHNFMHRNAELDRIKQAWQQKKKLKTPPIAAARTPGRP